MKIIAATQDPKVIRKILDHKGLPTKLPSLHPARGPPQHQNYFEDDFSQPHFDMNPQEYEVRTRSAGNFDSLNSLSD